MKKLISVILLCSLCLCSCADINFIVPENVPAYQNDVTDLGIISTDGLTESKKINYSYTDSLSSYDDVKKVGIMSGGVIVEGAEYKAFGYQCFRYSEEEGYVYTTIGECFEPFELNENIPEGVPVVKYCEGWSPIINIENKGVRTEIISAFPINGFMNYECPYPTIPGLYYLKIWVSFKNPMFDKDIEPEIGKWYEMQMKYVFALVVE